MQICDQENEQRRRLEAAALQASTKKDEEEQVVLRNNKINNQKKQQVRPLADGNPLRLSTAFLQNLTQMNRELQHVFGSGSSYVSWF